MQRVPQAGSSAPSINALRQTAFGWLMSVLAGVSLLLVAWALFSPVQAAGKAGWPEATLVLTTALMTLW